MTTSRSTQLTAQLTTPRLPILAMLPTLMLAMVATTGLTGCGAPKARNRPAYKQIEIQLPPKPTLPDNMNQVDSELIDVLEVTTTELLSQQAATQKSRRGKSEPVAARDPSVPALPSSFDLDTTMTQVEIQALLVADAEALLAGWSAEQQAERQALITDTWRQDLIARHRVMLGQADTIYQRAYRDLSSAQIKARWQKFTRQQEYYHQRNMMLRRAQPVPQLSIQEEAFLDSLR